MKQIREGLDDEMKGNYADSMQPPLILLESQMKRLSLNNKSFKTFPPASDANIDSVWDECQQIDENLVVNHSFYTSLICYV